MEHGITVRNNNRATRFLVNQAYKKLRVCVDDKRAPENRLVFSIIKQAFFDGFIWSPHAHQLSARRFFVGHGFAKCCLDLGIDPDYGQKVINELHDRLSNDRGMATLDAGLKRLTKQRKLEIDSD